MKNKGFSLIEVLVALTVTSMVAVSVFFAFSGWSRADRRTEKVIEESRMMGFALDRIRQVISSAYLSWVRGREALLVFEGMDLERLNEPFDALTFNSLAHRTYRLDAKEFELIEMTLFTVPDKSGPEGTRLLRLREGGTIDENFEVSGGIVYTLAWNVSMFRLFYLDSDGELKQDWKLAEKGNQLPCAVVVFLGIRPEPESEEEVGCILVPVYLTTKEDCVFERGSLDDICSYR